MNSYMIGYDLNKPEQNYINLITTIKESFDNWWHYLDSTWIVTTTLNTVEIRDLLQPHVDNDDELLVVKLTGEGAWAGFNQKASEWLKTNL
ncbi:MAG TPA: CRISPR-associated protein Cas2 [Gemmatimonadaceae bacterium]